MERDLDLIRKMLLKIEESPSGWAPSELTIDGYTDEQVGYHAYLLIDGVPGVRMPARWEARRPKG